MSSSWSDLPLDLLISIRKKLQNSWPSLCSFRSVCSQWHSASPIPNSLPRYKVTFNYETNIIQLINNAYDSDSDSENDKICYSRYISLPFPLSSPLVFFDSSNGCLVFIIHKNQTLHLFDSVSNRKFIFPPLLPKLLRYYKKVEPTVHDAYRLDFIKVVVSSSIDAGIAVAGMVEISNRTDKTTTYRRLVFCRLAYGDCQEWNLLMEGSKGIRDIALAGDDRFYALGDDWEFYMLHERPPLIKLKKFKLWLPKHILVPGSENSPADELLLAVEHLPITCYGMRQIGETDLKVYGTCRRDKFGGRHISFKINVTKLCGDSNNINVENDVERSNFDEYSRFETNFFTPLLMEHN